MKIKKSPRVKFAHDYAADTLATLEKIIQRDAAELPAAYTSASRPLITWTPDVPGTSLDFNCERPHELECIEKNPDLITRAIFIAVINRLLSAYEREQMGLEKHKTGFCAVEEFYACKLMKLAPQHLDAAILKSVVVARDGYVASSRGFWAERESKTMATLIAGSATRVVDLMQKTLNPPKASNTAIQRPMRAVSCEVIPLAK